MASLRDLCMELRKKKRYTLKKIADSVGLPVYVLKGSIYQGTRPHGENVYERLCKYFEEELGRPISEISFESKRREGQSKLMERIRELVAESGQPRITKAFNEIAQETQLSVATLEKWYYLNVVPKLDKLSKIANYFTKKLGREITVDYLLGKEPITSKEESLDDVAKHLELALSALKKAQRVTDNDQEKRLLDIFRKLSATERADVLSFLEFKLKSQQR